MRKSLVSILVLVLCAVSQAQNGDVVSGVKATYRYFKQRPTQRHAIVSTVECAVGIALSANPVSAATVGLPVLAVGNGLGYGLRNKHPRIAGLLQEASGAFCMGFGMSRHAAKTVTPVKPPTPPTPPPPTPKPPKIPVPPTPKPPVPQPPPPPPVKPPCTVRGGTDCGIGNGGHNPGTPSGPPFTPPGQGGTPGGGKKIATFVSENGVYIN